MAEQINMKELAARLGLDVSTVSRALRGDNKRVSARTIDRVQQTAATLGYVPDSTAASLRGGRSRLIGVLVQNLSDVVMGILVTGIDAHARLHGYTPVVVATDDHPEQRSAAINRLLARRVDGLILCDSHVGHEVPAEVDGTGVPYVFAMRGCTGFPSVTAHDFKGGSLVAAHLMGLGHQLLGVIPGPGNTLTAMERTRGFLESAEAAEYVECAVAPKGERYGVEDGFAGAKMLLAETPRPTAIFCVNDYGAIGAVRAIADAGLRPGMDIAVAGYNDIPLAAYLETPLTSVRTDVPRMGTIACQKLIDLLEGRAAESVTLEPELIARSSTLLSRR